MKKHENIKNLYKFMEVVKSKFWKLSQFLAFSLVSVLNRM